MNNANAERPIASGHRTRLHDSFKNLFSLLFSSHIYNIAAHLQSIERKKSSCQCIVHNARLVTNDNVQAKPIHTLDGSQLNEKSIYTYVTTTFIRSVFERHWVLVYDTTVRTNIKSTITMNSEICCMPHLSTLKPNGHQWYWHSSCPKTTKSLKQHFLICTNHRKK